MAVPAAVFFVHGNDRVLRRSVFFALGALTRSLVFVYLQGVLFVGLYLGMSRLMAGNLKAGRPRRHLRAGEHVSRYWTLVEANTRLIPLTGALLWNRILWLGLGVQVSLLFCDFSRFHGGVGRLAPPEEPCGPERVSGKHAFGNSASDSQFRWRATVAKFFADAPRVRSIVTDLPFIAIGVFTVALAIVNGWETPHVSDTPVYPVTYLMADSIGIVMLIVITTMYAGEVVWKERGLRYDQLHDALPCRPGLISSASSQP
jgi:hypothetical protein